MIMSDLGKIKQRLLSHIQEYRDNLRNKTNNNTNKLSDINDFSSTDYLFVSSKIARMEEFRHLNIAKIIAHFRTPWPKQSYQSVKDYSQSYKSKFTMLFSSVSSVFIFFVGSFLQLPPSLQDAVINSGFSAGFGYTVVLLGQLYYLYPALIVIPIVTVIILINFFVRAINAASSKNGRGGIKAAGTLHPVASATAVVRNNRRASLVQGVGLMRAMQNDVMDDSKDDDSFSIRSSEVFGDSNAESDNHSVDSESSSDSGSLCISALSEDSVVGAREDKPAIGHNDDIKSNININLAHELNNGCDSWEDEEDISIDFSVSTGISE